MNIKNAAGEQLMKRSTDDIHVLGNNSAVWLRRRDLFFNGLKVLYRAEFRHRHVNKGNTVLLNVRPEHIVVGNHTQDFNTDLPCPPSIKQV